MSDTPELDRAIVVAQDRVFNNKERLVDPLDRTYARALIAELLRDMPTFFANTQRGTTEAVCNEIRRRAGILEGEG